LRHTAPKPAGQTRPAKAVTQPPKLLPGIAAVAPLVAPAATAGILRRDVRKQHGRKKHKSGDYRHSLHEVVLTEREKYDQSYFSLDNLGLKAGEGRKLRQMVNQFLKKSGIFTKAGFMTAISQDKIATGLMESG
jgi:hypothetical protein